MNKIEINHFKAFDSRIALMSPNQENMLIYGENGSGKTSVYEALRMAFYSKRLMEPFIKRGASEQVRKASEDNFFKSFNHRKSAGQLMEDFTISINGIDYKSFKTDKYQCFMLSKDDIQNIQYQAQDGNVVKKDIINLKKLLVNAFFPACDYDGFLSKNLNNIIDNVNQILNTYFYENFEIGIENADNDLFINDTYRNLKESTNLHGVFNEAKINLVVVLVLLESIKLLQDTTSDEKNKLLVVDDIITSLDAGNRLFFANYFLKEFNGFQKVFLTHNVGFNNLLVRRMKYLKISDNWKNYNIYITNSGPQLYCYNELVSAGEIRKEFEKGNLTPADVGVHIRKLFEADINEVAKLFHVDATSRAMDILQDLLQRSDKFYYRITGGKIKDANDLVSTIKSINASSDTDTQKLSKISDEINKYYSDADVVKLMEIIKEFHYFEKLIIHSLSHGTAPMPTFIQKEVEASIALLKQLESIINKIKDDCTTL